MIITNIYYYYRQLEIREKKILQFKTKTEIPVPAYIVRMSYMLDILLHHDFKGLGEGNGDPLQYSCLENPMVCSLPGSSVHESV